ARGAAVCVIASIYLCVFGCLFDFFFFFFQAEDGIRDDLVTGVQTCALPICTLTGDYNLGRVHALARAAYYGKFSSAQPGYCDLRSEERRVGKECRSRWSA